MLTRIDNINKIALCYIPLNRGLLKGLDCICTWFEYSARILFVLAT